MMMMMMVMMILRNFDLLSQEPSAFILFMILLLTALTVSFTIHEFSHALVATSLGDHTAERLGRLSLNPRAHLDPAGSLMVLLAGFGWGKPVPVNPRAFGAGNALRYMMLVAIAGPLANFIVALSIVLFFKIGLPVYVLDFYYLPAVSSIISSNDSSTCFFTIFFRVFMSSVVFKTPGVELEGGDPFGSILPAISPWLFCKCLPVSLSTVFSNSFW